MGNATCTAFWEDRDPRAGCQGKKKDYYGDYYDFPKGINLATGLSIYGPTNHEGIDQGGECCGCGCCDSGGGGDCGGDCGGGGGGDCGGGNCI